MIPILYDHYEKNFTSQGVGRLDECLSCQVTEQINGEYECTFEYPVTGKWFLQMVNYGGIIAVEHDHNGDLQPFDIYRYEAPIDGVVTFYAHHISYRLSNLIVGDKLADVEQPDPYNYFEGGTPAAVFASIPYCAFTSVDFTFEDYSGYEPVGTNFRALGRLSVRDGFLNGYRADDPVTGTEAMFKVFPGEFAWDKFAVKYYKQRGSRTGLQIRYGKNMANVQRERDWSNLISVVYPFWYGEAVGPDGAQTRHYVFADPVYSPYAEKLSAFWTTNNRYQNEYMMLTVDEPYEFRPSDRRAAALDLSNEIQVSDPTDPEPTAAQLQAAALEWMSKNSTWRAYDNITVEFVDLYNSPDYAEIAELEKCSLGDYVDVIYPVLGIIAENVEIVSATYDVLADKFSEMQLGEIKSSFAQVIMKTIEGGNKA